MARRIPVLIRQRIVDELLRDTSRLYDSEQLVEAVRRKVRFLGYDDSLGCGDSSILHDITFFRQHGMVLSDDMGGQPTKPLRYRDPGQPNPVFRHLADSDRDILQKAIDLVGSMGDEPQFRWARMFLSAISTEKRNDLDEPFVDFHVAELEGMEHFDRLLGVCIRRQPIEIDYAPFDGPVEHHVISPYQLRHFNDRWYLIGLSRDGGRDHFAFDRISDIREVRDARFVPASRRFLAQYDDFMGVSHGSDVSKVHIDLLVTPYRYNYIRSKKIHPSQFATKNSYDDSDRIHVKLFMAVNKELITHLLSFGSDVEVMAPESLRLMMRERSKEIFDLYDKKN